MTAATGVTGSGVTGVVAVSLAAVLPAAEAFVVFGDEPPHAPAAKSTQVAAPKKSDRLKERMRPPPDRPPPPAGRPDGVPGSIAPTCPGVHGQALFGFRLGEVVAGGRLFLQGGEGSLGPADPGHPPGAAVPFGAMRGLRLGAIVLALGTLLAACGGGSSGTKGTLSPTSTNAGIGGTVPNTGDVAWPLPPADQAAQLTAKAGLQMETHETLNFHVHAHLDVFINGEHRTVPGGVGIVITDPNVHSGTVAGAPAYGGISVPCSQPCISPLHTHDATGILHTESATSKPNTLGQFFTEWDVRLDGQCVGDYCTPVTPVALYVDGQPVALADAGGLPLTDHKEIALLIGKKPTRIPSQGDFSGA